TLRRVRGHINRPRRRQSAFPYPRCITSGSQETRNAPRPAQFAGVQDRLGIQGNAEDKPMDRLTRSLTGSAIALLLVSHFSGCRTPRHEVPPGRPFSGDGKQAPPIEFSSAPNPASAMNGFNLPNTSGAGGTAKYGTPSPGSSSLYGAPANNAYGPPATAPVLG